MIDQRGSLDKTLTGRVSGISQTTHDTDPLGIGYSRQELLKAASQICHRMAPFGVEGELVVSMFSKLALHSKSAHTIFGTKPLSEHTLRHGEHPTNAINKGWITSEEFQAWQRVAMKAQLASRSLNIRESARQSQDSGGTALLIYDTHNIKEVFSRHRAQFAAKLGDAASADTLIERLHNSHSIDFNTLFDGDHELKGIIVGYGQKSAAAYARLVTLSEQGGLGPLQFAEAMKSRLATAQLPAGFPKEELLTLIDSLVPGAGSLQLNNAVSFRPHRDDEESRILLERYNRTAKALIDFQQQHGPEVVGQVTIARWSGLLP